MARLLLRGALLAAAATLGSPRIAQAHFHLNEPENWLVQATDGTPQKMGPCGVASETMPAAQMSNAITEYKAGETIAVKLDETVMHPGHYRVALAVNDRSELPPEPAVTPEATGQKRACGTAEVMSPAVMPVLVDGALDHTTAFNGEQTIMVKLPDDVQCEKCTLQVLEFMSAHGAPCFYHHCADIKITKDANMSAGGMGAGGMSAGGMSAGGMSAGGVSAGGMSAAGSAGMNLTAGSGGMGGATGQGGVAGAAITAPAGAGGAAGTGGSAPAMGGTGNATAGTGNTTAGTASGTAARAGTGTAPSTPAAASDTDTEGGCSVTSGRTSSPLALLALLGLAGLRARRAVRRARHTAHRV